MFAQIPGFEKTPDAPTIPATSMRSASDTRLETITIYPSKILWRAQLTVHCLLALCLSFALLPFFVIQPWWLLGWLMCLCLLLVSAFICRKALQRCPQILSFAESRWLLDDGVAKYEMQLVDDALVWSWLIVLRGRATLRRRRIDLVLLPDSAAADEQRRLRIWLRTRAAR